MITLTKRNADAARDLKHLLIETSPLIEGYTKEVCPACVDVCCKQKHGVFQERDIIYRNALGADVPLHDESRSPEGPCQFLGPGGCTLPRWLRPFKCTWFFCDPILQAMNEGPRRENRRFIEALGEMVKLYNELMQ
jgi:hypothetical protein